MTRRAPGWRWLHPRSPKVRPRTKAAPRPRRTPRPAPALARGRPLDPPLVLYADAPGGPAPCWRAILRTLLKKLLVAAPPRPSERMRPGRGRKRSSSSWLIGIDVGGRHKNTTKTTVVPRKAAQTLTFARERHCAAFWTVPRAVSQPVCRPRYLRAMARDGAIRFNLALRPSHFPLSPPSRLSLSRNHRSKICTPDRSRRSARGTAGSPRDEQRCAARHVARMPIMWRFEPGKIGNRTCAQSTGGLRPIYGRGAVGNRSEERRTYPCVGTGGDRHAAVDLTATNQCRKRCDIGERFRRQRAAGRNIVLIAAGAGVVGREKARRTKAIVHLAQVSRTRQNVVVRITGIAPEPVAQAQSGPGIGHDLHQSDGAFWRHSFHLAAAFDAYHRTYPAFRNAKPPRRLGNISGIRIDGIGRRHRRRSRLHGRSGNRADRTARHRQHDRCYDQASDTRAAPDRTGTCHRARLRQGQGACAGLRPPPDQVRGRLLTDAARDGRRDADRGEGIDRHSIKQRDWTCRPDTHGITPSHCDVADDSTAD